MPHPQEVPEQNFQTNMPNPLPLITNAGTAYVHTETHTCKVYNHANSTLTVKDKQGKPDVYTTDIITISSIGHRLTTAQPPGHVRQLHLGMSHHICNSMHTAVCNIKAQAPSTKQSINMKRVSGMLRTEQGLGAKQQACNSEKTLAHILFFSQLKVMGRPWSTQAPCALFQGKWHHQVCTCQVCHHASSC
jgi:hypothetical protein